MAQQDADTEAQLRQVLIPQEHTQSSAASTSYGATKSASSSSSNNIHLNNKKSLRVLIYTVGSRGDVQPYCALAQALAQKGHQVYIATEDRVKNIVLACQDPNIHCCTIYGDSTGILFQPEAQEVLLNGSFFQLMKLTQKWQDQFDKKLILSSYQEIADQVQPDLIVGAALTLTQAYCIAQYKRIPYVSMILGPTMPTREFPVWALAKLACCSCLNKWTYSLAFNALWKQEREFINPWRTSSLGLPALTDGMMQQLESKRIPVLIACSTLLCGPKQQVPSDYPDYAHVVGFPFVTSTPEQDIDSSLVEFIKHHPTASHKPIVYLGFGSMPVPDPKRLLQLAIDVCTIAQCRAIVIAGWSQLQDASNKSLLEHQEKEGVLKVVASAPHDWLFPQMQCIVHHCGVGTMAAALRAGRPQVPCPFMLDQPHNSQILVNLGVTPAIVPFNSSLTAERLGQVIKQTLVESRFARIAQDIGEQIRQESASTMNTMVNMIEQYNISSF